MSQLPTLLRAVTLRAVLLTCLLQVPVLPFLGSIVPTDGRTSFAIGVSLDQESMLPSESVGGSPVLSLGRSLLSIETGSRDKLQAEIRRVPPIEMSAPMYSPVGYRIAGVDTVGEATRPAGILVYKQQYCGVCHTFSKAGTKGPFGPSHDGIRATAEERVRSESYTGRATTAAEYLRESIVDPAAFVVPGFASTRYTMPAYSHLTDAEIDSLVALLLADD